MSCLPTMNMLSTVMNTMNVLSAIQVIDAILALALSVKLNFIPILRVVASGLDYQI